MASIRQQRLALGVTQQELADYLGISRSLFSMAEGGRRDLPARAQAKLSALRRNMSGKASAPIDAELQRQTEATGNILQATVQEYAYRAEALRYRLEKMRRRYGHHLGVFQSTAGVLAELPPGKDHKKEKLWLELLQARARDKMAACGPGAQMVLQLRLEAFVYHVQQFRARIV